MKILIFFLLIYSARSFACRPKTDFVAPSIRENFKKSEVIFKGKIISKVAMGKSTQPFGHKYTLSFQVEQNVKGSTERIVNLFTYSNTCDTFGQFAELGTECLIFANQGIILSGVLAGEASVCGEANLLNQKIKEIRSMK